MGNPNLRCSIDDTLCTWVVHLEHGAHKLSPFVMSKEEITKTGGGPSTSSVYLSMETIANMSQQL